MTAQQDTATLAPSDSLEVLPPPRSRCRRTRRQTRKMGQRCVLSPAGHCERGGCPHLRPGPTLRCALTVRFFVCALCRRSNAQRTPIWLRCMPCPPLCAVAHAVHSLLFYADGMLCLACFTAGGDVEEGTACGPYLQSGRRRGHRPHVPPQDSTAVRQGTGQYSRSRLPSSSLRCPGVR